MFYRIIRMIILVLYKICFRLKVIDREKIPPEGGVMVCCNHISLFDALTMAVGVKRTVCFMGKKELFKVRWFGFLLRCLNAFPVDREAADMQAYKTAIGVLNDGKVMGIFVEGHRFKDADTIKAKSGAAFFALKSGCAIVPAKISGRYRLFSKITIKFGLPIDYEELKAGKTDSKKVDALTEMITGAINSL